MLRHALVATLTVVNFLGLLAILFYGGIQPAAEWGPYLLCGLIFVASVFACEIVHRWPWQIPTSIPASMWPALRGLVFGIAVIIVISTAGAVRADATLRDATEAAREWARSMGWTSVKLYDDEAWSYGDDDDDRCPANCACFWIGGVDTAGQFAMERKVIEMGGITAQVGWPVLRWIGRGHVEA